MLGGQEGTRAGKGVKPASLAQNVFAAGEAWAGLIRSHLLLGSGGPICGWGGGDVSRGAAAGDNQQPGWEGTAGTSLVMMVMLHRVLCAGGGWSLAQPRLEVVAPCHGVGCGGHMSCQMGSSIAGGQSRQRWGLPVLSPLLHFVVKGFPAL